MQQLCTRAHLTPFPPALQDWLPSSRPLASSSAKFWWTRSRHWRVGLSLSGPHLSHFNIPSTLLAGTTWCQLIQAGMVGGLLKRRIYSSTSFCSRRSFIYRYARLGLARRESPSPLPSPAPYHPRQARLLYSFFL